MKHLLFFATLISLTAVSQVQSNDDNDHLVAPSTAFIELTELYQQRPVVAPDNNAFVYLLGISAPQNQNPMTVGQNMVDWVNEKIASRGENTASRPETAYAFGQAHETLLETIHCTIREATPCNLAENQALAHSVIADKQWLLARWQTLLDFPTYQNTQTIHIEASSPDYSIQIKLQRLALINLWLNREQYSAQAIKDALEKDYNFHLNQANNASGVVEKMVATALLQNNYYWLNEILKSVGNERASAIIPAYLTQAIPTSVLSMRSAYAGEFQLTVSLFQPYDNDDIMTTEMSDVDKQTLLNAEATLMQKLIAISESSNQRAQIADLADDEDVRKLVDAVGSIISKFIPEGKAISEQRKETVLQYATYMNRVQQSIAIAKAVSVLQDIRQNNIQASAIVDFLAQVSQHNPLTKQPFEWDAQHQQIRIHGIDRSFYLPL